MSKKNEITTSRIVPDVVQLPVFAVRDSSTRIMSLALAGDRSLKIAVRGEREVQVEVEKMPPGDKIAQMLPLETLVEILKIKMYNENISDQTVYDVLFEDRLEREWARAYRLTEQKKPRSGLSLGGRKSK